MAETTSDKIQRLAARRQALWAKAPALTAAERGELSRLTADLDVLWEQHRTELATPRLILPRRASRNGTSPSRKKSAA